MDLTERIGALEVGGSALAFWGLGQVGVAAKGPGGVLYIDPYLTRGAPEYPALVAIYPEGHSGTFRTRRVLHRFFPGVVRIALRYQVPVVPTAMIGFHWASPIVAEIERDHGPNDVIPLPPLPVKLKIEFGEPFELSEFYGRDPDRDEQVRIANQIVRPRIARLLEKHGPVVLEET